MATNQDETTTPPASDLAERLRQARDDARKGQQEVARLTAEWEGAILHGNQDVVLLEKQLAEAKVKAELTIARFQVLQKADAEAQKAAQEEAARKPLKPWVDPMSIPGHHLGHDVPAEVMVGPKRIVVRATLEQVLDDIKRYELAEKDDPELQKGIDARLTDLEWDVAGYQSVIQSFCDALKKRPDRLRPATLPAADLAPFHLTQWVDAKRNLGPGRRPWGPNHRRGAITAVQRAFSWAEKQGHILKSPIRHVEKPPPKRREQVLTEAEFRTLLSHVKDRAFRDVLEFCWETGCRVVEVRLLEARHYRPDRGRFEVPPAEAKGKKRWRVIYVTDPAAEIVARLAAANPDGPLFRNTDGKQWDAQNFNCRFCRLQVKLGVKYALTAVRHSFATRLLEAGVDHLTVSALLGHADGSMLARVYSHVGERTDFLRTELLRASGAGTAA